MPMAEASSVGRCRPADLQPDGAVCPDSLVEVSHHLFMNALERDFFGGCNALQLVVFRRGSFASIRLFDDFHPDRAEPGSNHCRCPIENYSPHRIVSNTDGRSFVK